MYNNKYKEREFYGGGITLVYYVWKQVSKKSGESRYLINVSIYFLILSKKSIIQKRLEDMDPLIKDILSKSLIGSCSIKEYFTASKWTG